MSFVLRLPLEGGRLILMCMGRLVQLGEMGVKSRDRPLRPRVIGPNPDPDPSPPKS